MAFHQMRAEVLTGAIRRNIGAIRRRIAPGLPICAAVKANAYGHGIEQVLPVLQSEGIPRLSVANLEEALNLRRLGWSRSILCFGPVLGIAGEKRRRAIATEAVAAGISCSISTIEEADTLAKSARRLGRNARIEIQVETGIGRSGILTEQVDSLLDGLARCPELVLDGVYTHFATADEPDAVYAHEQLRRFSQAIRRVRSTPAPPVSFHAANSAALFRLADSHLDQVRAGLSVYGYWGGPSDERPTDLFPALRLVSTLAEVRRLPAGSTIGYGSTFTTGRDSVIGTIVIGYADGYRRLLSNDAQMTLPRRGDTRRDVPVVGRVSMDQVTVDLTDAGEVRVGDEVVVIDNDPAAPNSVEALARKTNTIPYEITTLITSRVPRVVVHDDG